MRRSRFALAQHALLLLVATSLAIGCEVSLDPPGGQNAQSSENVGVSMPTIKAHGWLNGSEPTEAELAGKVVVLDCFATW